MMHKQAQFDSSRKLVFGVVALLTLLGGGTVYMLSQEEYDRSYVCTTTLNVGVFERLSSTQKTGYWVENGTQRQATCRSGIWQNTAQFLRDNPEYSLNNLITVRPDQIDPVEIPIRNTQHNITPIQQCTTEVTIRSKYLYTRNNSVACTVRNATCTDRMIVQEIVNDMIQINTTTCKDLGVQIDNEPLLFEKGDAFSLQTNDIVCTWSKAYGGMNLNARSAYWKTHIADGEHGQCSNITVDDSIVEFKSRSVFG